MYLLTLTLLFFFFFSQENEYKNYCKSNWFFPQHNIIKRKKKKKDKNEDQTKWKVYFKSGMKEKKKAMHLSKVILFR